MKRRVVDIIRCPKCRGRLSLQAATVEQLTFGPEDIERILRHRAHLGTIEGSPSDKEFIARFTENITSGSLDCTPCGVSFPIEQGIPVMLPPELRTTRGVHGISDPTTDEKLSSFADQAAPIDPQDSAAFLNVQRSNQSNYGYEWNAFSHRQAAWKDVYFESYVHEEPDFFEGKIGIDGGCGMGRYSLVAASCGAEMFGVDLSNAVEQSYRKSLSAPLFHAIQGDLFNLPFADATFSFGQSLGVIHITPNPELALESLKRTMKENGKLWIYVYPSFKDENRAKYLLLNLVAAVRRITIRLPSNILYALLAILTPFIWLCFYMPTYLMVKCGLSSLAARLPYSYVQYKGRRLRDIHMNLFDRFGNPLERRYDRSEIVAMFEAARFRSYQVFFNDGWMVGAVK